MQIRIIADGSTKLERFIHRWGLSFLVGKDIIFDTFGDPRIFLKNARRFGVDMAKIKQIVLSHDDWDHIAGLWPLLEAAPGKEVFICPGFQREIKERISSLGAYPIETAGVTKIQDGVYSTGQMFGEAKGRGIYEQALVVGTKKGSAIICGCAHPGVVNIVRKVKEDFSGEIEWLIGGFHLKDNADETNIRIVEELRDMGVRKVAPMHCTGKRAADMMRSVFGDKFTRLEEGDVIDI